LGAANDAAAHPAFPPIPKFRSAVRSLTATCCLEASNDAGDCAGDPGVQRREGGNREDADDGEDDPVLRHRLAFLLPPAAANEVEPLCDGHRVVHLLPGAWPALVRAGGFRKTVMRLCAAIAWIGAYRHESC